jgi:hypothetical protein
MYVDLAGAVPRDGYVPVYDAHAGAVELVEADPSAIQRIFNYYDPSAGCLA